MFSYCSYISLFVTNGSQLAYLFLDQTTNPSAQLQILLISSQVSTTGFELRYLWLICLITSEAQDFNFYSSFICVSTSAFLRFIDSSRLFICFYISAFLFSQSFIPILLSWLSKDWVISARYLSTFSLYRTVTYFLKSGLSKIYFCLYMNDSSSFFFS